jgi:hypothetical protein
MKFPGFLLVLLFFVLGFAAPISGEVPAVLNYQGRMAVDQLAFSGVAQFKFAIVNANGSQVFWRNSADANSDGEPDNAVLVNVSRGLYSVLLGDTNHAQMAELPVSVFTNSPVFLRVWFTDAASPFERLTPDHRIAAVGYALMAAAVPDASITAAKLAPGALVASNLTGSLAVAQVPNLDASKITTGVLAEARIPSLDADKIETGTISPARLPALSAAQITSGTIHPDLLPPLDASRISSGTFDPNRIPALDSSKIVSGTISAARLPGLDASQIVSGQFGTQFLPSNVAYTEPHISGLSAQIATLTARVDSMVTGAAALPAGATLVSDQPNDPLLSSSGFEPVMNVPAPGWITSTAADSPSARHSHAAIWAENLGKLFVWGGQVGPNVYSGAGALYTPALDQWQPITTVGAPSPRRGHSMVFNGIREAIVWGGFTESGYTNSGARFDLARAEWSAVSAAGAPSARDSHSAVYMSPLMVVWGGRNSSGPLNDGALYNSTTDQWRPLSVPGPPSARSGTSSVRADNRILIWGGTGAGGELNTGGQLIFQSSPEVNPTLWSILPTLNAPSARTAHAAVWTGSRMIIWGGRNGGTFLNDGAMFDPVADSWTPISSVGAPSARAGASVVWTGQEMLVFAGESASGPVQTGAAYNPSTGRWRALSSAGDAVARYGATGLWTGTELVLFGGQSGATPIAALQRLTPQPTWYFYRKL